MPGNFTAGCGALEQGRARRRRGGMTRFNRVSRRAPAFHQPTSDRRTRLQDDPGIQSRRSRGDPRSILAVVALSTILIVLSGCASWFNPHVTWSRVPDTQADITLQDGFNTADRAIDEYKKAIGEQAILNSVSGVSLIALSAAALGVGITEASAEAVTALGLSAAAGYGAATWLSSKPRQLVYAAGIKAMTCAKDAMLPLDLPSDQKDDLRNGLDSLGSSISDLSRSITNVNEAITKVEKLPTTQPELTRPAKEDVVRAREIVAEANTVLEEGYSLQSEVHRAGRTLISAVDRIGADVDAAIVQTIPDLTALSGIIGGLMQTSQQFTKLPEAAAAPPKGEITQPFVGVDPAIGDLSAAQDRLIKAAAVTTEARQKVAAVVNSVSAAEPAKSLKQCNVDVDEALGIKVHPPGNVVFKQNEALTRGLMLTGGKKPYLAQLLDEPSEGLKVKQPVPGGPKVEIEATGKAPANTYNLFLSDAAEHVEVIKVVVREVKPACPSVALNDYEKELKKDAEKVKKIQKKLGAPETGKIDSDTRVNIKEFMKSKELPETCSLTKGLVKIILEN